MYTETSHPRYGLRVAPEPGIGTGTTSVPGMRTQRTETEINFINRKGDL